MHDSIYLQQIPSRNKCKVESSLYDVYENEDVDHRNEIRIENTTNPKQQICLIHCLRSSICRKLIWVIIGMILIGVPISGSVIASYYKPTIEMSTGNYTLLT